MSSSFQADVPRVTQCPDRQPIIVENAEAFETPELNEVAELWRSKRGERAYPSREEFSLRELKGVLRNLAFLEIVNAAQGRRFFVRFMGSELDAQLLPMTGHFTDEVLDAYFQRKWHYVWNHALGTGRMSRSISRAEYRERQYAYVEGFYAPLATDGTTIDKLMIVACYHQPESATEVSRRCAGVLKARFVAEFGR
jgi:hypothetical protein